MKHKNVILPINIVTTGISISQTIALISSFTSSGNIALQDTVSITISLIYTILLWVTMMNPKKYYYTAMISSLIVFISQVGLSLIYENELARMIFLCAKFPLLVFLFSVFHFKDSLLKDTVKQDSMNILATYNLLAGLSSIVFLSFLIPHVYWTSYFVPAALIITAIGIYSREKFFGLVCSFLIILLPFIVNWVFFVGNWNPFLIIQFAADPIFFFIALILMKELFTKNIMGNIIDSNTYSYGGYGSSSSTHTVSKSCEACGKAVSINASVGDRCPHCGVIWEREYQRYL